MASTAAGNDRLTSGDRGLADGGPGDGILRMESGVGIALGGTGHDSIDVCGHGARAEGGEGNDRLYAAELGPRARQVVLGGPGNDILFGRYGDQLFGEERNDLFGGFSEHGTDPRLLIRGDGGPDDDEFRMAGAVVTAGSGNDLFVGVGYPDTVDGGADDDRIFGGGGPDELRGGSGNDRIAGEQGRDRLFGEDGNDILAGGPRPRRVRRRPGHGHPDGLRGDDQHPVAGRSTQRVRLPTALRRTT